MSLIGSKFPPQTQGTTRIADQVIEEVDEQMTVHSIRGQEKRPTAQSIFASNDEKIPVRSAPIDMPSSHHNNDNKYERLPDHQPYSFPSNEIFSSSSAPEEHLLPAPPINVVNSDDGSKSVSLGTTTKEGTISYLVYTFFSGNI